MLFMYIIPRSSLRGIWLGERKEAERDLEVEFLAGGGHVKEEALLPSRVQGFFLRFSITFTSMLLWGSRSEDAHIRIAKS